MRVKVQEHLLQLLHHRERTKTDRPQSAAQHWCLDKYVQTTSHKGRKTRDLTAALNQKAVHVDQLQVVQPVRTNDLMHNVQVLTLLGPTVLGSPNA